MSDVPEGVPVPLDALLAQRDWVRALARRLVADADRADEIEQRTWLAAVERPPGEVTSARGWLAATLRNAARKLGRGETRRARHEAASGARGPDRAAEDVVADAEMQQLVGRLVLELDEPYRSTVLLRFFEGLEPVEIARRQGVPPETVRTRLHRALARLRERLDVAHDGRGGRAAWSAALLTWTARGPGAGTAALRPQVAAGGVPSALGAVTGGLLMTATQKVVAAAVLLLLFVGGGIAVRSALHSGADDGQTAVADASGAAPTTTAPSKPSRAARPVEDAGPALATEPPPPPPVDLDRCDRDLDLHGVVVLRDGSPVANADVRAVSFPWRRTSFLNTDGYFQGTPGPSTRSATDGTFALRLGRGDVVTLRVAAAGLADTTYPDQVAGGRVRIVLTPGVGLRLVAVQADGTPATGVRLEVRASAEGLGECTREVTTDARGLATVDGLPPGGKATIKTLTAECGSMYWWDVALPAEGDREHRLDFAAFRTLRGRITDADSTAPIAGARVGMNWTLDHAVTSAADGSYALQGWTGHSVQKIGVVADGYTRADVAVGPRDVVDVALRRGFAVTGRIVAEKDRGPVAGALVGAIASIIERGEQTTSFGSTTAGTDGRFRITGLARDLPHVLIVAAPGHARARPDIPAPTPGADVDLGDVVLGAPRTVDGRVVDGSGAPIAGVEVNLDGPVIEGAPPYSSNNYGRGESRVTDDLGRFRFIDLPAGWFHLVATRAGASPVEKMADARAGDARDVVVRAATTRPLVVHVVDEAGKPLPGCPVNATTLAGNTERVPTDAGGAATLQVGAGAVQVEVVVLTEDDRAFIQPPPAEVPAGATEVTVVAREGVWLRARLVDPDGRGIEHAQCRIVPAGGEPFTRTTWAEGHLRLAVAPATSYAIAFDGAVSSSDAYDDFAGRADGIVPGADEVVIRCARIATNRTLRVRVLTPDGAPARGVTVFVTGAVGAPRSMRTGDDGTAPFEGLPAREHAATANAALGFAHANTVSVVPDGQTIDLSLRRANPIRGRVLDAEGNGASARVRAWWSGHEAVTTGTAPDGTFSLPIPEDAAGPFRIVAEGLGTDTVRFRTVESVAAGASGLEIRLPAR